MEHRIAPCIARKGLGEKTQMTHVEERRARLNDFMCQHRLFTPMRLKAITETALFYNHGVALLIYPDGKGREHKCDRDLKSLEKQGFVKRVNTGRNANLWIAA